jgi:hypothetical protein
MHCLLFKVIMLTTSGADEVYIQEEWNQFEWLDREAKDSECLQTGRYALYNRRTCEYDDIPISAFPPGIGRFHIRQEDEKGNLLIFTDLSWLSLVCCPCVVRVCCVCVCVLCVLCVLALSWLSLGSLLAVSWLSLGSLS